MGPQYVAEKLRSVVLSIRKGESLTHLQPAQEHLKCPLWKDRLLCVVRAVSARDGLWRIAAQQRTKLNMAAAAQRIKVFLLFRETKKLDAQLEGLHAQNTHENFSNGLTSPGSQDPRVVIWKVRFTWNTEFEGKPAAWGRCGSTTRIGARLQVSAEIDVVVKRPANTSPLLLVSARSSSRPVIINIKRNSWGISVCLSAFVNQLWHLWTFFLTLLSAFCCLY